MKNIIDLFLDFKESDNFAECDLKDVDIDVNEDDELIVELNLAVVDIYFRRLKEREVKKT